MIPIADGSFVLTTPQFRDAALKSYARRLFAELDRATSDLLPLDDYEISLLLEQGSVKGRTRVLANAKSVVLAITAFGGFVQGVRELSDIGKAVVDHVAMIAPEKLKLPYRVLESRRSDAGNLTKVKRLFEQVAEGILTPDEAANLAAALLTENGESPQPDLKESIAAAARHIQLNPRQLLLPGLPEQPVGPAPRAPRGSSEISIADQRNRLRIEIRREHKNGRTKLTVIPL